MKAKGSLVPILLSGTFAIILHYTFSYVGLQYTDSSIVAILKQVGPLLYVCFSSLFFKNDHLTVRKLAGVLLGIAGVLVLNVSPEGIAFHRGDVLIICASVCMVFANVISKKLFEKEDPITATGCSQLFGGIVLLMIGKLLGGRMDVHFDESVWVLVVICFASVISYCLWYGIVKRGKLSKLFIIKFTEPMFAALFGALLLGEDIFRIEFILAFVLIAAGISVSQKESDR